MRSIWYKGENEMSNIKLRIPELKKHLKELEQKELIQIIAELYKMNQEVKDFLHVQFIGEEVIQVLYERAKKEIRDEFFPDKGFGKLRLANAKKAITYFRKQTNDTEREFDLMLNYVEDGVEFTNTYGDIDERFYKSIGSMYLKVVKACENDKRLFENYKDRLYTIVLNTDGIGWGFHDYLKDVYYSINWLNES